MNISADKTTANKSQPVANSLPVQKNDSDSAVQLVDNRPEAINQQSLQEMANTSTQVSQLQSLQETATNSPLLKRTAPLFSAMYLASHSPVQKQALEEEPVHQKKENNTGLPDTLKTGVENLSGISLDDVNVHYNSEKPAQLQAHAYASGTDIHLAAGQEKHLPHEAWHVVQQKQGRVRPTLQMKAGVNINDDEGLEKEADVMGEKALQMKGWESGERNIRHTARPVVQRRAWGGGGGLLAGPLTPINDVVVNGAPFQGIGFTHALPASLNKRSALVDAATFISGIGAPAKNSFLAQNFLNANGVAQTILPAPIAGQVAPPGWPNPQTWNNYRNPNNIDPFLVNITASYPDPLGGANIQLILTYEFGRASYGYIVQINQNGAVFTMNAQRGQNVALGPDEYPSAHDTAGHANDASAAAEAGTDQASLATAVPDTALSTGQILLAGAIVGGAVALAPISAFVGLLAGVATVIGLNKYSNDQAQQTQDERRRVRNTRLDAITKIAGEGARWQCVRQLAAAGNLRNDSSFYATHPITNVHHFVTFATLWASWDNVFASAFNIADATVSQRLLQNPAANWNGAGLQTLQAGPVAWTANDQAV
jgi:hypothetical protein